MKTLLFFMTVFYLFPALVSYFGYILFLENHPKNTDDYADKQFKRFMSWCPMFNWFFALGTVFSILVHVTYGIVERVAFLLKSRYFK